MDQVVCIDLTLPLFPACQVTHNKCKNILNDHSGAALTKLTIFALIIIHYSRDRWSTGHLLIDETIDLLDRRSIDRSWLPLIATTVVVVRESRVEFRALQKTDVQTLRVLNTNYGDERFQVKSLASLVK